MQKQELTKQERIAVEKASKGEHLTGEEYKLMSQVAGKFNLEHDLKLSEAGKRILKQVG
jgi:hypothetical protein